MERLTQQNQYSSLKARIIEGQWHYYMVSTTAAVEINYSLFKSIFEGMA